MKNKKVYIAFIVSFILLYVSTAMISLFHAVEFFSIGNVKWMSIVLASVFELGQMVVLSSLLLSDNKKTFIPWMLLVVLTAVQVVGNVFSVFKYMSLSGSDYYIYLQKPLIDWWLSGVSQDTIMVIISWIIGALLPIIALFMTSMVANNIKLMNSKEKIVSSSDSVEKSYQEPIVEEKEEISVDTPIEVVEEEPKEEIKEEKKESEPLEFHTHEEENVVEEKEPIKPIKKKKELYSMDTLIRGLRKK